MFSIACTITKKTVSSSLPSSPTSTTAPSELTKPVAIKTSSVTTTTTRIPSHDMALSDEQPTANMFRRRSTFRKLFMSLGIVLLAGATVASAHLTPYHSDRDFPPRTHTPCLDEVASLQRHAAWLDREYGRSPAHRAHHLPQCLPSGLYNATQCRSELDLCWCVGERTGRVLSKVFHPGQAGEIRCTDADDQESEEQQVGSADDNSAGNSTLTGNNSTMNGNATSNSTTQPQPQQPRRKRLRDGPCIWAKRELAARRREKYGDGARRMLGAYEPQCTDDGLFERTQCHASSGFCWCVDEHTGERISQAFRSWARGIDCDAEEFLINASFRA